MVSSTLRLARGIETFVAWTGRLAAWLVVVLVAVTVFDVITRRYFVLGSTALQELEWHLHTAIFTLCLGYAYIRNAHVRIEILRERMAQRSRAWVEVLGCLLFLVPYCLVTLYYSIDFAHSAFVVGERSTSPGGLCCRWIIKSVLSAGLFLMLLAGIAVLIRHLIVLLAPERHHRLPSEDWQ